MAAVRMTNGSVLTRSNEVVCQCCAQEIIIEDDEYVLDFLNVATCECSSKTCYKDGCPPQQFTSTGQWVKNLRTNFSNGVPYFLSKEWLIQFPYTSSGTIQWSNIVDSPKLVRLYGSVGGDIRIYRPSARSFLPQNYTGVILPTLYAIIDEGLYPCGECLPPRNGVHDIDYTFALAPFHWLRFDLLSGTTCDPWARLKLRVLENYSTP